MTPFLIFSISPLPNCFTAPTTKLMPFLLGGSGGDTKILSVDSYGGSSLTYIAFGGQSADTSVVGSSTLTPIAGVLDDTLTALWVKAYSLNSQQGVNVVRINQNGSKLLLIFDANQANGCLTIAYLSITNGAVLAAINDISQTTFQLFNGIGLVSSSDIILISFVGLHNTWEFKAFAYSAGVITITKHLYISDGEGTGEIRCHHSHPSDYAGRTLMGGFYLSTGFVNSFLYGVSFDLGYLTFNIQYAQTDLANYYYVTRVYEDYSTGFIYLCQQYQTTAATAPLIFSSVSGTYNSFTLNGNGLLSVTNVKMTCLGVSGSSNVAYYYIQYSTGPIYMLTATFSSSTYSLTQFTDISNSNAVVLQATIISASVSFYGGYLHSITDPILGVHSYSPAQAFILPFAVTSSCFTSGSTVTNANFGTVTWSYVVYAAYVSIVTDSVPLPLSPTISTISTSSANPPSWCTYVGFISGAVIGTQTYSLRASTLTFSAVGSFTGSCADVVLTYSIVGSLPLGVTFSGSTFTVQTSDINAAGTFTITVRTSANDLSFKDTTFTLIISSCGTSTITSTSAATYTFDIGSPSPTVTTLAWTQSNTACPSLLYSIPTQSYIPSTALTLFFLSGTDLQVNSQSSTTVGTYTLTINAADYLNQAGTNFPLTITVTNCLNPVITPSTIASPQTYTIGASALTIVFSQWTSVPNGCGAFSYSIGFAGTSGFNSFTSSNTTFVVSSTSTAHSGVYTVTITGSVLSGTYQASTSYQLIMVDPCPTATISYSTISTQAYVIASAALVIPIAAFTNSAQVSICGAMTYSIGNQDNSAIDSIFTFSTSPLQLTVSTALTSKANTYNLVVKGMSGVYSPSASLPITVVVQDPCLSATLTPPADLSANYQIPDAISTITLTAFTSSVTICGSFSYSFASVGGGAIDSTLFTTTTSSQNFQVYSTDQSKAATYHILVTATLGVYGSTSCVVTVVITINCNQDALSFTQISDQTYGINSPMLQFVFSPFSDSLGYCGVFTYTATGLPSCVQFFATNQTFLVYSTTTADAGSAVIMLTGSIATGGNTITQAFILNLVDPCLSATIASTPVSDTLYRIAYSSQAIPLTAFTSSSPASLCGAFIYTLTNKDLSPYDTALFTFSSSTLSLVVYTMDTLKLGNYNLTITGKQGIYSPFATLNVNINIYDPCLSTVITPSTPGSLNYSIPETLASLGLTVFTDSVNSCGTFTYTYAFTNGTAINTNLFSGTSASPSLSIYSTDQTLVGAYSITITGTLIGSLATYGSSTTTISGIIDLSCTISVVVPSSLSNQTYVIVDPVLVATFVPWTDTIGHCGSVTYSTSALPAGVTFFSGNQSFVIYTTTLSNAGNFSITLTGTLTTYSISTQITFWVEIIDPCFNAVIAYPVFPNITYGLFTPQLLTTFASFTSTPNFCGSITYTSSFLNMTALNPSLITFFPLNNTYIITANSLSLKGSYQISITGALPSAYPSVSTNFTLEINCFVSSIDTTTSIEGLLYSYQIGSPKVIFGFSPIAYEPANCNYSFTYTLNSSTPDYPSFIQFQSLNRSYSLLTSNSSLAGNYEMNTIATLNDPQNQTLNISFSVMLSPQPIYKPEFLSPFPNLVVKIGTSKVYTLPDIKDLNSAIVQITYPNLLPFCTINNVGNVLTIAPPNDAQLIKIYQMQIKLVEKAPGVQWNIYQISIEVTIGDSQLNPSSSSSVGLNSGSPDVSAEQTYSGSFNITGSIYDKKKNMSGNGLQMPVVSTKNNSQSLTAVIYSVSSAGLATVKFSENVIIPSDYQYINSSYLGVRYQPTQSDTIATLDSWEIQDFNNKSFTMQLTFNNSEVVSQDLVIMITLNLQIKDKIELIFIANGCFVSSVDMKPIQYRYNTTRQIPPQLSNSSSINLYLDNLQSKNQAASLHPSKVALHSSFPPVS